MDAVNRRVAPPSPILRGPQAVLIPTGSFEQRAVAGQSCEPEFALPGNQVAVQMLGRNLGVRAPLAHRRRSRRDAESQQVRLVPDYDGLNDGAGGEIAIAHSAGAMSLHAGSRRIRQPGAKKPLP